MVNKMKILTISIAAYNAENYIAKCLDSLIKSKYLEQLDIIVVNDGSRDRTSQIAHQYSNKYDSIRVIDKENGGHGSTINTSISLAEGKYYKVLDSDDAFDTCELDKLVVFLTESDVDLVLTNYHKIVYG